MTKIVTTHNPLIEEAQLGQRLNESVRTPGHSDFSLMLAMLVEDVRMHSQFQLPHDDINEPEINDDKLRNHFSLPPKAPMALTDLTQISQYGQADLVEQGLLSSVHLSNALNEKAIAFRNDKRHIPSNIIENTNLYCQLKHKNADALPSKRKEFDAKSWIQSLQNTIVNAPIVEQMI
ncbi:VC2046/SO_2500 family protein [Thalassotalea sediminis]|uniref:VC2046/SO_2500 family protein n=1 Tax=Thalassotalea sediminis TaxID=1759089 RepID=UPI00257450E8|nr:VC2046/SO_2500 family protein [Thalassotalea sediminis]